MVILLHFIEPITLPSTSNHSNVNTRIQASIYFVLLRTTCVIELLCIELIWKECNVFGNLFYRGILFFLFSIKFQYGHCIECHLHIYLDAAIVTVKIVKCTLEQKWEKNEMHVNKIQRKRVHTFRVWHLNWRIVSMTHFIPQSFFSVQI